MLAPMKMADDFETGTRSAACGGTTTVIPFAAQQKGHSLRAAVDDYHSRAAGKALIDYAFHLIVSDPTEHVRAALCQLPLRKNSRDSPAILPGRAGTSGRRMSPRTEQEARCHC